MFYSIILSYCVFCDSKYMWMLTFNVSWGTRAFYSKTSCDFFSFFFSQSNRPTQYQETHLTLNEKKRGMALRFCSLWASGTKLSYSLHVENTKQTQKIFFIGCISSSLDCFSITKKFRESFPARQTLHDNFLINDIGNAQFYCKLKYTCMQIWLNKIWYSHCPDLFAYTSSSLAFFLVQWVKSTVIFPSRPC